MSRKPANIKAIVAAGARPADAIKAALPGTVNEFAAKYGFIRNAVSMCINSRQRHARIREALAKELGVELEWLDQLLDSAREAA